MKHIALLVVFWIPFSSSFGAQTIKNICLQNANLNLVSIKNIKDSVSNIQGSFNHDIWNNLLKKHVSKKGVVNYKGFIKDSKKLKTYIDLLGKNIPEKSATREAVLAYWINAYNALTVDLIIRNYPTKSIKNIEDPWNQLLWKLGNKTYNLDEIEHDILRKMNEPRIHFAIVCASYSCPKLLDEAYSANKLESQLNTVTKDFIGDSERNTITQNTIKLSKIFNWFEKDFKQTGTLIDFLNQYSEIEISKDAKKSYKDYNWDLND